MGGWMDGVGQMGGRQADGWVDGCAAEWQAAGRPVPASRDEWTREGMNGAVGAVGAGEDGQTDGREGSEGHGAGGSGTRLRMDPKSGGRSPADPTAAPSPPRPRRRPRGRVGPLRSALRLEGRAGTAEVTVSVRSPEPAGPGRAGPRGSASSGLGASPPHRAEQGRSRGGATHGGCGRAAPRPAGPNRAGPAERRPGMLARAVGRGG